MGFADDSKSKRNRIESNDSDSEEETVVMPPDGGWGWVVVFGSFMIHVIADGISYSFGVVIKELLIEFEEGKGPTSWIVSILIGVTLASGPIASAITNRFGCRSTTMVGGLIATAGSFLSYFGGSVFFLIITMGVITGLGFGLMYCPAIIIVTVYFEKRRALATGIAVAGAGVGTLIFPPLTAYLMTQYTWRGTFFIYSGIILNCVVCGALFRAPPTQRISKLKNSTEKVANGTTCAVGSDSYVHAGGLVLDAIAEEDELEKQQMKNQWTESAPETTNATPRKPAPETSGTPDIVISSVDDVRLAVMARAVFDRQRSVPEAGTSAAGDGRCFSSEHISNGPNRLNQQQPRNHLGGIPAHSWSVMPQVGAANARSGVGAVLAAAATLRRRGVSECQHGAFGHGGPTAVLNRKDIFYRGSVTQLPEYQSNPQLYRSQTSLHRPPSVPHETSAPDSYNEYSSTGQLSGEPATSGPAASGLKEMWMDLKDTLRQMVDPRIMKDVLFIMFAVSNFLTSVGMTPPLVFLPDRATSLGLENDDFLLSIYGIFNTLGRLAIGWISDQRWANRLMIYNVSLSIGGIGTILSFLCRSFGWLSFYAGFYGVSLSAYISLTSVILVDVVGLDLLTNAFGILLLFQGIASLIGAPIAGTIADITGNYDGSFYFAGVVILLSGLMLFPLPCIQRLLQEREEKRSNERQAQMLLLTSKPEAA